MPVIVVTQPSDGTTADVTDVNSQIDAILAVVNGNLDQDNLKDGGVTNAKLAGGITPDKLASSTVAGWASLGHTPNSVAALGNRSYSLVFNATDLTSLLSPGMRVLLSRTVAAPTECTSLNGSTQFYSKSSPSGMTFTDDFVVSAWIKVSSYVLSTIASRFNGTSGWGLFLTSSGQIQLTGYNGGGSNFSSVVSSQSIPLNKWVHVTAQLDMSSFTASATTSYTMLDGVDVPCTVTRGGTNPTALIQAGNLEIGSNNGGSNPLPGKIAQVAIYSAKVTEATILASMNQTLAGTETSLISAYSFNNSVADLDANANNLTANGSAVATNADSPFAQAATAGTLEYAIVTAAIFSTNTTLTLQVPEGSALPTSGGISAVSYSAQKAPYLFPMDKRKWKISFIYRQQTATASNSTFAAFPGISLIVPVGSWDVGYSLGLYNLTTTEVYVNMSSTSQTGLSNSASDLDLQSTITSPSAATNVANAYQRASAILSGALTYILYTLGATTSAGILGSTTKSELFAEFNYL